MSNINVIQIWENPEIQELNRLPMRSPLMPFTSAKEAIADALAGPEHRKNENNGFYLGLDAALSDGVWKFKLLDNPNNDDLLWTKPSSEKETSTWACISVPGTWARQGGDSHFENCFDKCFDTPHYTNVQMPFEGDPPHTPEKNSTGLYRRTFTLPPQWKGRRTVLHVGSAESVPLIYVNGVFAGMGKDSRLPSEYDISSFVKEGENLLCIKVVRYSDASFIEDQDQWWLGGIHRSVYLYSTENSYMKDIKAVPGTYHEEHKKLKGEIELGVTLGGNLPKGTSFSWGGIPDSEKEKPFTIKYSLHPFTLVNDLKEAQSLGASLAAQGGIVSGEIEFLPNYRMNSDTANAKIVLDDPLLWSHEHPNLYILCVELYREGRHIESAAFCTGFRNIKIAKRELLINGKMVYIKGANRHEHDEKTGKTLSTAAMLKDIKLLKEHNFNAVRTSHYPNDERWYELCDRYGIYLWDEADIESHCFYHQLCNDPRWLPAFLTRMQRMAKRDKNHPSVIVWSLGNESGWGGAHDAGSAWLRYYDTTRPIHYEGVMCGGGDSSRTYLDNMAGGQNVTDIVSPMYPSLEAISDFVNYRDDYRPLIMCEFSHAMGNSNGSLQDYWKLIENRHGLQGGFIWEWKDHGFEAYTPEGVKYWKYGGDFGDEPSDKDFVCDGLLWPDQTPKPSMEECKQLFAPVCLTPHPLKLLHFTLENKYDFSNLDNLRFEWSIREDSPIENSAGGLPGEIILAEGKTYLPSLKPGEKTELSFGGDNFSVPLNSNAVYFRGEFILKTDMPLVKAGHVVCHAEQLLKESSRVVVENITPNRNANDFVALFKPSLYRVPTQNDGLKTGIPVSADPSDWFYTQDRAMIHWLKLDLLHLKTSNEKTESVVWEGRAAERYSAMLLAGDAVFPEYRRFASGQGLGTYSLTIAKNEKPSLPLAMEVVFDLDSALPELPKVGISAKVPAYYGEISWFGKGANESYPDRLAAAFIGRYRRRIAELEVPYIVPQENGNRSGVRNFTMIADNVPSGKPQLITVFADAPVNFSCSRYSLENLWEAKHTWELKDTLAGPDGYYTLNIDIAQRGVGTATCGPDTRMEYRIKPGLFRMKLYVL